MIRRLLFACAGVLTILAVLAIPVLAAPMTTMAPATSATMAPMTQSPAQIVHNSMAGTSMNGASDATPWRDAVFALVAVILVGVLVLRRDRSPSTIGLVAVAALVVLGMAYAQSRNSSTAANMGSMQGARGSAPVPVTLARVRGGGSDATIAAPANVEPYFVQNVMARAPGLLGNFSAYTGDRVYSGEIVARLNEPELGYDAQAAQQNAISMGAQMSAARENVRYWNAEIARERYLLGQGAVSVQEYQNERAQAAAARSQYESVRAQLAAAQDTAHAQEVTAGYTSVIVPDDGVVMKRLVDPGVYVQAGTPILQMAVISHLRVRAQVAQQNLGEVHVGTPVDVMFDDGRTVHGRISSISPVVDPDTHVAIAEAIVPNPGDSYQPGAFVHVMLHAQGSIARNTFVVPSGAIVGGETAAVWVDRNGSAHRVPVRVISDDGLYASVTGDLQTGVRVVVSGAEDLEEGQAITPATQ